MTTPISIRLPDDLARHLGAIAKETERPFSFLIKKALEAYLEDYADLQVALDRLHDKKDPKVSSQQMRKSVGL